MSAEVMSYESHPTVDEIISEIDQVREGLLSRVEIERTRLQLHTDFITQNKFDVSDRNIAHLRGDIIDRETGRLLNVARVAVPDLDQGQATIYPTYKNENDETETLVLVESLSPKMDKQLHILIYNYDENGEARTPQYIAGIQNPGLWTSGTHLSSTESRAVIKAQSTDVRKLEKPFSDDYLTLTDLNDKASRHRILTETIIEEALPRAIQAAQADGAVQNLYIPHNSVGMLPLPDLHGESVVSSPEAKWAAERLANQFDKSIDGLFTDFLAATKDEITGGKPKSRLAEAFERPKFTYEFGLNAGWYALKGSIKVKPRSEEIVMKGDVGQPTPLGFAKSQKDDPFTRDLFWRKDVATLHDNKITAQSFAKLIEQEGSEGVATLFALIQHARRHKKPA